MMHQTIKNISLLLWGFLFLLGACTKNLDAPLPVAAKGIRDTAASIRNVLRNSPYTLFCQAFTRAGLDSPYAFYTVFAPSDSAMIAAGLTSSVINSLSLDSLYKIVGYHIVQGMHGDSSLENDTLTVQIPTLLQDVSEGFDSWGDAVQIAFQQNLYLTKRDVLYVGGIPANRGEATLEASNGWIYPLDRVLQPPFETVWSIILSKPELSMYVAANRLVDSLYTASYFYNSSPDSILFNTVTDLPSSIYSPHAQQQMVTVLAPTNDAFAKAGFNTIDDLRQYVNQSIPNANNSVSLPNYPYYVLLPIYNSMDSVLKLHYLYNPGQSIVFYQDMLYSPDINDGWMNTNSFYKSCYQSAMQADSSVTPVYNHFANQGGVVEVQWNPHVDPAAIPFSGSTGFLGLNGVVYEVDQLFYPHN